jgi:hypothetical protein
MNKKRAYLLIRMEVSDSDAEVALFDFFPEKGMESIEKNIVTKKDIPVSSIENMQVSDEELAGLGAYVLARLNACLK